MVKRRWEGQRYLASKLIKSDADNNMKFKGANLASSLVDCRFSLAKVCMPLLRELEFDGSGRNYVVNVMNNTSNKDSDGDGAAGMLTVKTETDVRPFVGSDAVHTFGTKVFYEPIQREIEKRMNGDDKLLRFCPTVMNGALGRNVELVKRLTGLDQVRFKYCTMQCIPVVYLISKDVMDSNPFHAKTYQVRYSLSGSEAVDAALKDLRATTSKPLIVRFTSAYHGHTSGINFLDCPDHVFLPECAQSSIDFIERYHYRIAAVIVNPMQHFTGVNKASPPGEKVTHSSRIREATSREEYARWLHGLQEKCNYCTKYLTKV